MDWRLQGLDALNKEIADLKSEAERSTMATFRPGIMISLIFIAISVYMTILGFVSWALGRPRRPSRAWSLLRRRRAGLRGHALSRVSFGEEIRTQLRFRDVSRGLPEDRATCSIVKLTMVRHGEAFRGAGLHYPPKLDVAASLGMH